MKPVAVLVLLAGMVGCNKPEPVAGPAPSPVSFAKDGFTAGQAADLRAKWSWNRTWDVGDASVYAYLHWTELYPSAIVHRSGSVMPLERKDDARVGAARVPTSLGEMSLDEYLGRAESRAQGFIVVHKGRVAYERYPGMREDDSHITMSVGKTTVGLVIALLEAEGKVDVGRSVGSYVPELKGSAWDGVKVIDALNMASGLDVTESLESRDDPKSVFGGLVRSVFGVPGPSGRVEREVHVIRAAKRVREPGGTFEYSSVNTQALVLVAEAVEGRRWAEIFERRVWSKVGAEGDVAVTVGPDGVALAAGFYMVRLRDLARFGMLYTPSWDKAARERVVSDGIVEKIRGGRNGGRELRSREASGEAHNSRQWDWVWEDGDFFKGGMHEQGLYVSPGRDLVVAWFATAKPTKDMLAFARKIAESYRAGRV